MDLDVSDILTFLLVICGFIALKYQSRSVKISEKELETKVVQISDLLHKIEKESKIREKETIDRLNGQAEIIESQASMYNELLDINIGIQRNTIQYIQTISLSTAVLAKIIQSSMESSKEDSKFNEMLSKIQLGIADLVDLIDISQKWSEAIKKLSDESLKKRTKIREQGFQNSSTIKLMRSEQQNHKSSLESITQDFSPKAVELRDKFVENQELFIKFIKGFIDEHAE